MYWSVKQTKITVLLLLFCSVLCTHAQVSSLSKSDSGFISYRLEGEPAHRLFLHKDTLRVEVKGIGLFPHYTLSYVIAQDGCLQRVGTPNARQTVKKGIDMDLSISASLDGKCLRHISDNEIRISGNNRPYFREQAVKNVLHGMDLLWIYDGAFVRDTIELGRLYKTIKDNLQNVAYFPGEGECCRFHVVEKRAGSVMWSGVVARLRHGNSLRLYFLPG